MAVKITPSNGISSPSSALPNNSYTHVGSIIVGAGPTYRKEIYIKFPTTALDNIPSASSITYARLIFTTGIIQADYASNYYAIYNVTSSWQPSTLNWNNKPPSNISIDTSQSLENFLEYHINIESWIRDAFANRSILDYGIRIVPTSVNTDYIEIRQPSEGYFNDGFTTPQLYIEYTPAPTPISTTPPTITSVTPNSTKSAINIVGGGVDSNTVNIIVYRSSDNVNFTILGYATKNAPNWSIPDATKAPLPSTPTLNLAIQNGDEVKLTWNQSTQASVTRYHKAYETLSNGTSTAYSNTTVASLIPDITKYTVERMLSTQTTWTKLTDIAAGSTLQFVDTTLPVNVTAQYRVYATNSQNTIGASSPKSITIHPPSSPTLNSVVLLSTNKFRLLGSGAITSG